MLVRSGSKRLVSLFIFLGALAIATPSDAQSNTEEAAPVQEIDKGRVRLAAGAHAGLSLVPEIEFLVGFDFRVALPWALAGSRIAINAAFDIYPLTFDEGDLWAAHVNAQYPFSLNLMFLPYVSAGLSVFHFGRQIRVAGAEVYASTTRVGVNMAAGAFFDLNKWVQPFVEFGGTFSTLSIATTRAGVYIKF